MKEVLLRCGAREPDALVATIMIGLRALLERNPIDFYEAVMLARNPRHRVWGASGDVLVGSRFAQKDSDGAYKMHELIRHVLQSAVEGDGLALRLVDPIVPEGA